MLNSTFEIEDLELGLMAQEVDGRHTLIHLEIEGVIDNLLYTEKHTMRARMSNGVCLTCTRRAGNYFRLQYNSALVHVDCLRKNSKP